MFVRLGLVVLLAASPVACSRERHDGAAPVGTPPPGGGNGDPNGQETHGGDRLASLFIDKGYNIYDALAKPPTGDPLLAPADMDRFLAVLRTTRVEPIPGPFTDGSGVVVPARNLPDPLNPSVRMIQLDQDQWTDFFAHNANVYYLVFHEYLWVLGIDDTNYVISHKLTLTDNVPGGEGTWKPMSDDGAPQVDLVGDPQTAAASGATFAAGRLLVLKGDASACRNLQVSDYDVQKDHWNTVTAATPGLVGAGLAMSGTDDGLFAWGGACPAASGTAEFADPGYVRTGFHYTLADGTFKAVTTDGAPSSRRLAVAIATPTSVFLWGGVDDHGYTATGALYDLKNDRWQPITGAGAPAAGRYRGVYVPDTEPEPFKARIVVWQADNTACAPHVSLYDPNADHWTTYASKAPPAYPCNWDKATWTGYRFVFMFDFPLQGVGNKPASGVMWEPSLDRWTDITGDHAPAYRTGDTVVWTKDRFVVFGGKDASGMERNNGYVYVGSWQQLKWDGDTPVARYGQAAFWTGTYLVIWGGRSGDIPLRTGALWQPD